MSPGETECATIEEWVKGMTAQEISLLPASSALTAKGSTSLCSSLIHLCTDRPIHLSPFTEDCTHLILHFIQLTSLAQPSPSSLQPIPTCAELDPQPTCRYSACRQCNPSGVHLMQLGSKKGVTLIGTTRCETVSISDLGSLLCYCTGAG